jgi:hypothetical protein
MSELLWQAQVRVDKVLACLLARAARAAGEKYNVTDAKPGPQPRAAALSKGSVDDLKKCGTQVSYTTTAIQRFEPDHVPEDLMKLFANSVADVERLAGISQPFQGIAPKGITAGIAIQTLASMSGRRVSRMATHLAEAFKSFGHVWAIIYRGMQNKSYDKNIKIKVRMAIHEDETKAKQTQVLRELKEFGLVIPPEELANMIPGITADVRRRVIAYNKKIAAQNQLAQVPPGSPVQSRPEGPSPVPPVGEGQEYPGEPSGAVPPGGPEPMAQ